MTPLVITLAGPERVGKSTTALEIVRAGNHTGRARFGSMAFADPIYKALSVVTNVPVPMLHAYKARTFSDIAAETSCRIPAVFLAKTVREALRAFGSEAVRRTFGESVWLDHARARIDGAGLDVVVIEDARTPTEYAFGRLVALSRDRLTYSGEHETDCAPPVSLVWRALCLDGLSSKTAGETIAGWALEMLPARGA